jgi:hypothetical protein
MLERHMGHLHLGKFLVRAFPFFDVLVETAHVSPHERHGRTTSHMLLQHFKQREGGPSTATQTGP